MEWGVSDMLRSLEAEIFVRKPVRELLFEGYEDKIMDIGSAFGQQDVVLDRFGWFYKRNGTTWADGEIEMRTGEGGIDRLGEIVSWNNETRTEAYEGECGRVRGSAEGLFPPGLADIKDSLTFYSTDICRPLHFTKSGLSSIHGIPVTTFHLDSDNFANTTHCADNHCYNNNLPTGVQNVTQCKMKSPAFVSRPHFYQADQSYLTQFQSGLSPDPQRHDSVFMIEPKTSIPLKVDMKLQLNIFLRKVEGIDYLFNNIEDRMYPVLWFHTSTELSEEMAGSLDILLNLPFLIKVSALTVILVSILIIISVIIVQISQNGKVFLKVQSYKVYKVVPNK